MLMWFVKTEGKNLRHGDLSNETVPRIIVVFENCIAHLPKEFEAKYDKAVAKKRWWEAISYYEFDEMIVRKILDITWRKNFNVNVVTWLGEKAAEAINEKIDDENIPVRGCFASSPQELARNLAFNPDIICVFDPVNAMAYGKKGALPGQLGKLI